MQETHPEAAAVLSAAGWKPHDEWGVYTHGSLVMGSPRLGEFHVKNVARCPDGPDTPDDPVEAARWLVARFPVAEASEPEETPAHEAHSETGAEAGGVGAGADLQDHASGDAVIEDVGPPGDLGAGGEPEIGYSRLGEGDGDAGGAAGVPQPDWSGGSAGDLSEGPGSEILDADYTDPTDPPPEAHPSGAFIFGDNLEQKRTAAIGLVVQEALTRLPAAIDYSRMSELRNFTMGVSEGRWPDDPAKREELDLLEATERLRRAIEAIRDAKIETLLTATREEIEAFDTQDGWP